FFFSSRRRHTRSKRDWSSDVCSSDLRGGKAMKFPRSVSSVPVVVLLLSSTGCATYRTISTAEQGSPKVFSGTRLDVSAIRGDERSEERRVGKEGRGGGGREQWKKRDE